MSVSIVYARSLVAEFDTRLLDTQELLITAGLTAARLGNIFSMLSYEEAVHLTKCAVALSGDEGIGHAAGLHTPATALKIISLMVLTQPTLRSAAKTFERYARLVSDGPRFSLSEHDDLATWSFLSVVQPNPQTQVMLDYAMAFTASIASDLTNIRVGDPSNQVLREVHFQHAAPSYADQYRQAYGCPVLFERAANALVFSRDLLDARLVHNNGALSSMARVVAERLLREVNSDRAWSKRVRFMLEHAKELAGTNASSVASRLRVSERSLRRRLERENASVARILEELRERRALQALRESEIPIAELSTRLGFASASAFGRAFRAWTGSSPAAFRRSHQRSHPVDRGHR